MKAEIVHVPEEVRRAEEETREDPSAPKVGRWYWVSGKGEEHTLGEGEDENDKRWFGCVTHVGSNYAEITAPGGGHERIHEDEFYKRCKLVPNPRAVIDKEINAHQIEIRQLMEEVKAITRRLAIAPAGAALPAASETQALALRGGGEDLGKYKTALSKAKEKELPEIFEKIEQANKGLGLWLSADIIPLKAQAKAMRPAIEAIEERIFSVEIYAGLSEEVELVADGAPAAAHEKVHLMQRRCYCDEECLARYETGGMEFEDMGEFHRWLARAENMTRLLPFPKCIVAFRVRRNAKEREWDGSFSSYFRIKDEQDADKLTFLYIRNGEKLFCLATKIEFDDKLFPDMDHMLLRNDGRGKLYAKIWGAGSKVDKIISEQEYLAMIEEWKAEDEKGKGWIRSHYEREWHPFERGDVLYDDIHKHIQNELKKHNRLMLVLQGLLDRSPVLHPHPPWAIWTPEGFEAGLALIYDEARTLTTGDKPDFEAYRSKLNAQITDGSVTVGQDDYWAEVEAEKENDRRNRDYRWRGEYRPSRYRPPGNPGPGKLARVAKATKGKCTFKWEREKWGADGETMVRCSLTAPSERLLNASAYKPGDFKIFFEDPRTRAEYLEWAPLLLEAEEYHAGNREVAPPPAPPKEKSKFEKARAAHKYKLKKERRAFHHKAVRLRREVHTKGGTVYPIGSLWRVVAWVGGTFDIEGTNEDGTREKGDRYVRGVGMESLEIDESIPAPEAKKK
jgi:hypothetical protein